MAFRRPFRDRRDAGRVLAERLKQEGFGRGRSRNGNALVAALPRGGVPVAYEVSLALDLPLDIVLVRKLGVPAQPELGMGALGEDSVVVYDRELIKQLGITSEQLEAVKAVEAEEIERQRQLYRRGHAPLDVAGRTVILVDDGAATGVTAAASARVLKAKGAGLVIGAFPVGPPGIEARVQQDQDEVICLEQPGDFRGVGGSYIDFGQTGDDEVVALLGAARG